MTKEYIGNCSKVIDWNSIITSLKTAPSVFREFDNPYETPSVIEKIAKEGKESLEYDIYRENEIGRAFEKTPEVVQFYTFHCGEAYQKDLEKKFADWIGVKSFMSWISKVIPGKCAAPHIDDEEIYKAEICGISKNKLVRYHCHVSPPMLGAAFMLENGDCFHMEEQGSVYKWPKPDALHCGMNAGYKPKYTFHFIGVVE